MEDRPKFEIIDGAVVSPLIAPWPDLSPSERAEAERRALWAYYLNGGSAHPSYFDPQTWIESQRSR